MQDRVLRAFGSRQDHSTGVVLRKVLLREVRQHASNSQLPLSAVAQIEDCFLREHEPVHQPYSTWWHHPAWSALGPLFPQPKSVARDSRQYSYWALLPDRSSFRMHPEASIACIEAFSQSSTHDHGIGIDITVPQEVS